ncbi:hypothetical protein [Streptomyces sp. CAU 1734]|uniref:hypothetical protein n=1 Tax=Streptomyces sp. CAU 1734 TaxID=3140360 RepID=UPI003261BC36
MDTDTRRFGPGGGGRAPSEQLGRGLRLSGVVIASLLIASTAACTTSDPGATSDATSDGASRVVAAAEKKAEKKAEKPPPRIVTRSASDSEVALYAVFVGKLAVNADGCVVVRGDRGGAPTPVVWAHGWTASWENGKAVVHDDTGKVFAREGEKVSIGGGSNQSYKGKPCVTDVAWTANPA